MWFLIVADERWWCLEDLHFSVNQYFPNSQCMMLQNGVWATVYKIDEQQGSTVEHRELYSISCNNLYWKRIWKRRYIYTYIYLSHSAVPLKLTQHCKLTILQFLKWLKKVFFNYRCRASLCWRWTRGINLRSSQGFSEPAPFLRYVLGLSRLLCICGVFWMF